MDERDNIVQERLAQAQDHCEDALRMLESTSDSDKVEDWIEDLDTAQKVLKHAATAPSLEDDHLEAIDNITDSLENHIDEHRTASAGQNATGDVGDSLESAKVAARSDTREAIHLLDELMSDLPGVRVQEEE